MGLYPSPIRRCSLSWGNIFISPRSHKLSLSISIHINSEAPAEETKKPPVNIPLLVRLSGLLPNPNNHPRGPQTPRLGSVCLDCLLLAVVGLSPEPQTHCHSAQVCRSESHSNMRKRGDTVAVATNQCREGRGLVGVCLKGELQERGRTTHTRAFGNLTQ